MRKTKTFLFLTEHGKLFTATSINSAPKPFAHRIQSKYWWVISGALGTGIKCITLDQLNKYGQIIDQWSE